MPFSTILRIVTVVLLGLVVAHEGRVILGSVIGQEKVPARVLLAESLTGGGAFIVGLGLLPGGSANSETMMMLAGSLVWAVGMLMQPPRRG